MTISLTSTIEASLWTACLLNSLLPSSPNTRWRNNLAKNRSTTSLCRSVSLMNRPWITRLTQIASYSSTRHINPKFSMKCNRIITRLWLSCTQQVRETTLAQRKSLRKCPTKATLEEALLATISSQSLKSTANNHWKSSSEWQSTSFFTEIIIWTI